MTKAKHHIEERQICEYLGLRVYKRWVYKYTGSNTMFDIDNNPKGFEGWQQFCYIDKLKRKLIHTIGVEHYNKTVNKI